MRTRIVPSSTSKVHYGKPLLFKEKKEDPAPKEGTKTISHPHGNSVKDGQAIDETM